MSFKKITCITILLIHQNSYNSHSETQKLEPFCIASLPSDEITKQLPNEAFADNPYFSKDNPLGIKLPNPKDIIDPKTGKPYTTKSARWEAFWILAYQRDQLLEERRKIVLLEKQKSNEIRREEDNAFEKLNRYKKIYIDYENKE